MTEVMTLTTLIALCARKDSFKYSTDRNFCPEASGACWDTSRVKALPTGGLHSKARSFRFLLAALGSCELEVKLGELGMVSEPQVTSSAVRTSTQRQDGARAQVGMCELSQ